MLFTFFCLQIRYAPYMHRSALPLQIMLENRAKDHVSDASVLTKFDNSGQARNRKRYVFDYNVLECTLLVCGKFSRKIVPNIKLDIHIHVFNTEYQVVQCFTCIILLSVSYTISSFLVSFSSSYTCFATSLESLFRAGIFLLLSGLVFNSAQFEEKTTEYTLLVWLVILVVVVSTLYCLGR